MKIVEQFSLYDAIKSCLRKVASQLLHSTDYALFLTIQSLSP